MKFRLPVVIFGLLAVLSSVVKCETVDLSDDTFQDFIDKHLIVFVMLGKFIRVLIIVCSSAVQNENAVAKSII